MNLVRDVVSDAAIGVGVADTPDGLEAIRQPGCAAAIWRRHIDPEFQFWLDALLPDTLPRARMILPPEDVGPCLADLFEARQVPDGAHRSWLQGDIEALTARFVALMPCPLIRLRLDVVSTNACRRFHVDAVTARLICTYRGTGTQYGVSTDGEEPRPVFTVPTGSPVVLRGTLWPDPPSARLLHRSPPIEGTGETRLLLVIDPIFDADEEC
ncbi:MAG: DUF1826 domain-containing protein [Pseudomonadota bacterium]